MGMLKEGVRLDRVRGGRQKYRARTAEAPYQTPNFASKKSSLEGKLFDSLMPDDDFYTKFTLSGVQRIESLQH